MISYYNLAKNQESTWSDPIMLTFGSPQEQGDGAGSQGGI
jgi:hypothetical protein